MVILAISIPASAIAADQIPPSPKEVLGGLGAEVFGKKDFFAAWFKASPDFKYELKKIVSEGDRVWAYGTYSGTHQGEWLGIPASNKPYEFDAVDIFRVEDGKLAEHWDVLDVYGLFKQLEVIK